MWVSSIKIVGTRQSLAQWGKNTLLFQGSWLSQDTHLLHSWQQVKTTVILTYEEQNSKDFILCPLKEDSRHFRACED